MRQRHRAVPCDRGESIPSNIVLSAQAIAELTYTRKSKQLNFQRVPEALAVIDGQHRLWGYHLCKLRHRVPVAIYSGLDQATEARLFLDINTKHKGVPKELLKNVKSIAGTETEIEANLRRIFQFLNTDEASPLRGKLNVGESSPGKAIADQRQCAWSCAESELLSKQPPDKQQELVLNYLRAFHGEIDDKEQLVKRNYFARCSMCLMKWCGRPKGTELRQASGAGNGGESVFGHHGIGLQAPQAPAHRRRNAESTELRHTH